MKSSHLYLSALLLFVGASAFELPDLGSVFQSFYKSSDASAEDGTAKERVKRQQGGSDESPLPYVATVTSENSLPKIPGTNEINTRYMPTLGNGHLATTVYSGKVYLNGLYSGLGSESHRAVIPASVMGRLKISNDEIDRGATKKYHMNVQDGYFMEEIDCDFAIIEHKMYVHRYYIRLLVSSISWRLKNPDLGGGKIEIKFPSANLSQDLDFSADKTYHAHIQRTARTKVGENGQSTERIHIFAVDPVRELQVQARSDHNTVFMTIDRNEAYARREFDEVNRILNSEDGEEKLFESHVRAWRKAWATGHVEVFGDKHLAKIAMFSQYYILSSLPSLQAQQEPPEQEFVYGVSRTSLAKGDGTTDFQGHVTWDNEMYILPAFMLLQPELVKRALRYRTEMAESAAAIAESMGAEGYKYPYRSARTGQEVSPSTCSPDCENKKYYVTGAVAWAIRQYVSATRDIIYLTDRYYRGCEISREIARFFYSKSTFSHETARYSLGTMTGPDETYPDRKDNTFTMVAASLAIHWARYAACMCHLSEREEVPDEWVQAALDYDLPFDNVKRQHEQFDGFFKIPGARVSQADTIMLTYPLNWNMSRDIMRHDLEFYESITSSRSPAMTWSFFTVGWKWAGDLPKMDAFFLKSHQDYLVPPFYVWTEYTEGTLAEQREGMVNFLPGMGGFLQSLIYGYVGIRIRPEMLEFHHPTPPPNCERILLSGMKYLGTNMTIEIDEFRVTIEVHEDGQYPLVLKRNASSSVEETLLKGAFVEIVAPRNGFFIYTNVRTGCEHPRDHIYMPWGYSPFVDSASNMYPSVYTFLFMLLVYALHSWS